MRTKARCSATVARSQISPGPHLVAALAARRSAADHPRDERPRRRGQDAHRREPGRRLRADRALGAADRRRSPSPVLPSTLRDAGPSRPERAPDRPVHRGRRARGGQGPRAHRAARRRAAAEPDRAARRWPRCGFSSPRPRSASTTWWWTRRPRSGSPTRSRSRRSAQGVVAVARQGKTRRRLKKLHARLARALRAAGRDRAQRRRRRVGAPEPYHATIEVAGRPLASATRVTEAAERAPWGPSSSSRSRRPSSPVCSPPRCGGSASPSAPWIVPGIARCTTPTCRAWAASPCGARSRARRRRGGLVRPPRRRMFAQVRVRWLPLACGAALLAVIGVVDDVRGLGARTKLLAQFAAAALVVAAGCVIREATNPFTGASLALGALAIPVTIVWIMGVTNALNLIDGLYGLAAGVGLIVSGTLCLISLTVGGTMRPRMGCWPARSRASSTSASTPRRSSSATRGASSWASRSPSCRSSRRTRARRRCSSSRRSWRSACRSWTPRSPCCAGSSCRRRSCSRIATTSTIA